MDSASGGVDRASAFRANHRIGDRVLGTVLRAEGEDMAWVDFEGHALLTSLGNCPPQGTRLSFLVLQLHPEIRLKEFRPRSASAPGGLASAVQLFISARAAFEAAMDAGSPLPPGREAFHAALDETQVELLGRVEQSVDAVNEALPETRPEQLGYAPWIAPRARDLELLFTPNVEGLGHAVLGLRLAPFGAVQIRGMTKYPLLRCRIYADHPREAERLAPLLVEALDAADKGWDMQCHGAEAMPKRYRGGLPAELLSPLPHSFRE